MKKDLPDFNIKKPLFVDSLVALQYQKNIFLCSQTSTRWRKTQYGLERDLEGEVSWKEMGAYVDKSYYDIFSDSYRRSLDYTRQNKVDS